MARNRKKLNAPAATMPVVSEDKLAKSVFDRGTAAGVTQKNSSASDWIWRLFRHASPDAFNLGVLPEQSASMANKLSIRDPQLFDLYDEMVDKDPTIASCEEYAVSHILALEVRVEPADESDEALAIAQACEADLIKSPGVESDGSMPGGFGFYSMLTNATRGIFRSGMAVHETMWTYDQEARRFRPRSYVHRHPGQFAFDPDGRIVLWRDFDEKKLPEDGDAFDPIPYKFSIARRPALYGSPYGHSLLHELRWHWAFKREMQRSYLLAIDKHGTPLAKGSIKSQAGAPTTNVDTLLAQMEAVLENLTSLNAVVLRPDQELEFISRGVSASGLPHEAGIAWIDGQIMRRLIGSTLHVQEAEHGSRAQASVHQGVSDEHNLPLAKHVEHAINSGIVAPWYRLNYTDPKLMPRVVLDTDTEMDVEQAVRIIEAAARYKIGMTKSQAREWLGVTAPEEGEELIEAAAEPNPFDPAELSGMSFADRLKKNFNRIEFSQRNNARRGAAIRAVRLNETVAAKVKAEAIKPFTRALDASIAALDEYATDKELPMSLDAAAYANMRAEADPKIIKRALYAGRAFALRDLMARLGAAELSFEEDDQAQTPGNYSEALDWMEEIEIIKPIQKARIVNAVRALDPLYDSRVLDQAITGKARMISEMISESANNALESALKDAVSEGTTLGDFLSKMDRLADSELLPGGTDAYFENVFRTETASAYGAMTREKLSDPDVSDFVWGVELINPDDDRSRESHAAINGLLLKKGSAAFNALPPTPFSYQCRCTAMPVLLGDPGASDLEEPANALELVRAIETFDS